MSLGHNLQDCRSASSHDTEDFAGESETDDVCGSWDEASNERVCGETPHQLLNSIRVGCTTRRVVSVSCVSRDAAVDTSCAFPPCEGSTVKLIFMEPARPAMTVPDAGRQAGPPP